MIAMAESQSEHRQHLERIVVEGDSKRASRGLVFSLIVSLGAFATAGVLGVSGHETAAIAVAGMDIGGFVVAFMTGSTVRYLERRQKNAPFQAANQRGRR